jgi:hypothetical protein
LPIRRKTGNHLERKAQRKDRLSWCVLWAHYVDFVPASRFLSGIPVASAVRARGRLSFGCRRGQNAEGKERKESDLPHYGNPYDDKTFNNNYRKFMPAKMSKNGISLSNQYISIDNPSDFYKYQIYDRYRKEKSKNNILLRSGSSLINEKEDYMKYKYNNKNSRKLRVSSSSDNIYYKI